MHGPHWVHTIPYQCVLVESQVPQVQCILLTSALSCNLHDLHVYKGLFGKRIRAEKLQKLISKLTFTNNCL